MKNKQNLHIIAMLIASYSCFLIATYFSSFDIYFMLAWNFYWLIEDMHAIDIACLLAKSWIKQTQ